MLQVLKLFVASRNAAINEVHFPAELGPSYVYASPRSDRRSGRKVPRHRSERRPARHARREPENRQAKQQAKKKARRSSKAKPRADAEAARAATDWCPPAKPGELEAKSVARKVSGGFPVFYPTRLPSGAAYVETNPYRTRRGPARLPLQGHRRQPPRRLPDGGRPSNSPTASTTSASRGSSGWTDPPILDDPSLNARRSTAANTRSSSTATGSKLIAWHRGDNTYWVVEHLLRR